MRDPRLASAALAAFLFAAYAALAPTVSGDKDASEIALGLATCGVLHPTGYPVYTLAGAAFVRVLHALGIAWPHAANLFSAAGAFAAVYLLHRLALRFVPPAAKLTRSVRFAVAAVPVLLLAFDPAWLDQATGVEVHSWQLAWMCGTALAFVGMLADAGADGAARHVRRMALWGFLCGLGGTNHVTAVFYAGALTLALAWALVRSGQFRPWTPAIWLGSACVPLLAYLYLHIRAGHPGSASVWPALEPGWRGLWSHVTAAAYHQNLGRWMPEPSEAAELRRAIYPFLWPGLALLAGAGLTARESWRRIAIAGLLAGSLAQLLFVYRYGVTDPAAYFLPPLAVALIGTVAIAARVAETPAAVRRLAGALACAGLVALAVPGVQAAREKQLGLVQVDELLQRLWRGVPYDRGIVLWPNSNYYRLHQYQRFLGQKPGLGVYATAMVCNDLPRERFRGRFGFDPMARCDSAHLAPPPLREFVLGTQSSEAERRLFALVNQTIVDSARVPVALFDPPDGVRIFRQPLVPGTGGAGVPWGGTGPPDSARSTREGLRAPGR